MNSPDVEVYRALTTALSSLAVRWYVFGAQAAILHGAVRLTEDIDVTVLLEGRETRRLVQALEAAGFTLRVSDSEAFVEKTRVLPVKHSSTAIPVDVVLGGPGLEEIFAARARAIQLHGVSVPVATAEDVVAMKILAGRPKDLEDVVAVVSAQGTQLDVVLLRETVQLIESALDQSDLTPLLEQCLAKARDGSS
jgi:acylphosphatase